MYDMTLWQTPQVHERSRLHSSRQARSMDQWARIVERRWQTSPSYLSGTMISRQQNKVVINDSSQQQIRGLRITLKNICDIAQNKEKRLKSTKSIFRTFEKWAIDEHARIQTYTHTNFLSLLSLSLSLSLSLWEMNARIVVLYSIVYACMAVVGDTSIQSPSHIYNTLKEKKHSILCLRTSCDVNILHLEKEKSDYAFEGGRLGWRCR